MKELMLDRHCNGVQLPENLFLMAAANPYRMLAQSDREAAVGLAFRFAESTCRNLAYRVHDMPVSFYDHVYDFGHLCDEAEDTYIREICQHILGPDLSSSTVARFISTVEKSHKVARQLSVDSRSAVSLRDATRAARLLRWFCCTEAGKKIARTGKSGRELAIYLVYAFRFRQRRTFLQTVFGQGEGATQSMRRASRTIATKLFEAAHGASIGSGAVALNDALCENLFALYVCVLNGIFLIIVGRPGSSKSLSVEILKLVLSPGNYTLRQQLGDVPSLTELYFQVMTHLNSCCLSVYVSIH